MKIRRSVLWLIAAVLGAASLHGSEITGRSVMERFKRQDRTADSAIEMTMTIVTPRGGERKREVTLVSKTKAGDNRSQLIRFLSPADIAGTGFLSIEHDDRDDDTWLYLPALRKTRRIAGSEKTDSFVGSDFAYEDLDSENLDKHNYRLTGSEDLEGIDTWVIEATPNERANTEETGYGRRVLWISKDHAVLIQAKYYGSQGTYLKRYWAEDIRPVEGSKKWRAYVATMENVVKGSKTILEFSSYRIDRGIPDDFFSERYLKRGR